jgi:dipeptidase D
MDMVPQKTVDSTHNFLTDPIETYIDGDWVKAKGTTLGSDDGIGDATSMAIMEDNTLKHGPVEAIFTVDEETCMYGVNHLEPGTLKGKILLNLDNETEGDMVIGSAGGEDVEPSMEYKEVDATASNVAVKIVLKGLKGGHSGLEINEGRANANKLMARLLTAIVEHFNAELASWNGGNMRNAIPNNATALLTVAKDKKDSLIQLVETWADTFKSEYHSIEDGISLTVEDAEMPAKVVPAEIRDNVINAIMACPAGVYRMIPESPEIVETSCNLGIVKVGEGKVEADILVRSSCDSQLKALEDSIQAVFSMAGMAVKFSGRYGAWQPDFESPIIKTIEEVYRNLFHEDCRVQVVHAGLECSVIKGVYPDMDMVSFGPTLRSPHTPNERCNIPSVAKYWEFVKVLLENIPVQK